MMICACILLSGGSQLNSGYGVTDVSALNKPKTKKNQSMNEPDPLVQGNTLEELIAQEAFKVDEVDKLKEAAAGGDVVKSRMLIMVTG